MSIYLRVCASVWLRLCLYSVLVRCEEVRGVAGSQEVKPVLLYNIAGGCHGVCVSQCGGVRVCVSLSPFVCAWLGVVGSLPGKHLANYHLSVLPPLPPLPSPPLPSQSASHIQGPTVTHCGTYVVEK